MLSNDHFHALISVLSGLETSQAILQAWVPVCGCGSIHRSKRGCGSFKFSGWGWVFEQRQLLGRRTPTAGPKETTSDHSPCAWSTGRLHRDSFVYDDTGNAEGHAKKARGEIRE